MSWKSSRPKMSKKTYQAKIKGVYEVFVMPSYKGEEGETRYAQGDEPDYLIRGVWKKKSALNFISVAKKSFDHREKSTIKEHEVFCSPVMAAIVAGMLLKEFKPKDVVGSSIYRKPSRKYGWVGAIAVKIKHE